MLEIFFKYPYKERLLEYVMQILLNDLWIQLRAKLVHLLAIQSYWKWIVTVPNQIMENQILWVIQKFYSHTFSLYKKIINFFKKIYCIIVKYIINYKLTVLHGKQSIN